MIIESNNDIEALFKEIKLLEKTFLYKFGLKKVKHL